MENRKSYMPSWSKDGNENTTNKPYVIKEDEKYLFYICDFEDLNSDLLSIEISKEFYDAWLNEFN